MAVSWGEYVAVVSPLVWIERPETIWALPRARARELFRDFVIARAARRQQFEALLSRNGLRLSTSNAGLRDLTEWFAGMLEPDTQRPGDMKPIWYTVASDIRVVLGDELISRCSGLRWELDVTKTMDYQQPVIAGNSLIGSRIVPREFYSAVSGYGVGELHRQGHFPAAGVVTVKSGASVDVDKALREFAKKPRRTGAFAEWVQIVELAYRDGESSV